MILEVTNHPSPKLFPLKQGLKAARWRRRWCNVLHRGSTPGLLQCNHGTATAVEEMSRGWGGRMREPVRPTASPITTKIKVPGFLQEKIRETQDPVIGLTRTGHATIRDFGPSGQSCHASWRAWRQLRQLWEKNCRWWNPNLRRQRQTLLSHEAPQCFLEQLEGSHICHWSCCHQWLVISWHLLFFNPCFSSFFLSLLLWWTFFLSFLVHVDGDWEGEDGFVHFLAYFNGDIFTFDNVLTSIHH